MSDDLGMELGCARPWGELIVDVALQQVRHCDASKASLTWPDDFAGTLDYDLANALKFTRIRREMLCDQAPPECRSCHEIECQGRISPRLSVTQIKELYGRAGVFFTFSHLKALLKHTDIAAATGVVRNLQVLFPEEPEDRWTEAQKEMFGAILAWFHHHGHGLKSVIIHRGTHDNPDATLHLIRAYGEAIENRVISNSCELIFDPPIIQPKLGLRFEIHRWSLSSARSAP